LGFFFFWGGGGGGGGGSSKNQKWLRVDTGRERGLQNRPDTYFMDGP